MKDICAVIVTYNPKPQEVQTLIERIAEHVGLIVIVDNGSRNVGALLGLPARLIELGGNKGVATAQNVGIRAALERDYKFVILFDQDSLPNADMIPRLLHAYETLTNQGVRVAAVGANWRERNSGWRWRGLTPERPFIKENMLISSGCLISAEALRDVGMMMEELFIDHIDTEWCMRATRKYREHGKRMETTNCWKVYIACDAHMGHAIGLGALQLGVGMAGTFGGALGFAGGIVGLLAGGRIGPVDAMLFGVLGACLGGVVAAFLRSEYHFASATRLYYGFRNSVYLWTRSDLPLRWKLRDVYIRIAQFVIVSLGGFPANRFTLLKLILRGIWDGLRGHLGPYRSSEEAIFAHATR